MFQKQECRPSEQKFKEWLDHKNYPFLWISNTPETYSGFFKVKGAKRPDFLILINSIGLIAVDVKERKLTQSHETFILDEKEEIQKYVIFERLFKIPVWFAFSNDSVGYRTWYWVSLGEILSNVPPKISSKSKKLFRGIKFDLCKTVGWEDGLYKLFGI